MRLLTLGVRQVTKPFVRSVIVASRSSCVIDRMCVWLGRASYASHTAVFRIGLLMKQRHPPAGDIPPLAVDASNGAQGRFFAFVRNVRFCLRLFVPPSVSDSMVRDSGAEVLVELLAYIILALLLWSEYAQSVEAARSKEAQLEAKFRDLESRLAALASRHSDDTQRLEILIKTDKRVSAV